MDQAHEQVCQLLSDKKAVSQHLARRLREKEVLEGVELRTVFMPELAIPVAS